MMAALEDVWLGLLAFVKHKSGLFTLTKVQYAAYF